MPPGVFALSGSSTSKASIGAAAQLGLAAIYGRRIAQGAVAHTVGEDLSFEETGHAKIPLLW